MKKALGKDKVARFQPADVHPILRQSQIIRGYDIVCDYNKSNGLYLYDALGKKFYLDMSSLCTSSPLGLNHPKLTTPEMINKLGNIAINKSMSGIRTIEEAQFVETFKRVAMADGMKYLSFVSNGIHAVEKAITIAFEWKKGLNLKKGTTGDNKFRTISFGDSSQSHSTQQVISFPQTSYPIENHINEISIVEDNALAEINAIITRYPDEVACILIEPIQKKDNVIHFRQSFIQRLREITDKNDIILFINEIRSGMGITGKLWAYEHYNVEPDILSFGHRTQVYGIMATDRIKTAIEHSTISQSSTGSWLVDMVRAQKILEIIEENKLIENAAQIGDYLIERLYELQNKFPNLIYNVRGFGLFCTFDLDNWEQRDRLATKLYTKNLLLLTSGKQSLSFRPSLICGKEHVDKAMTLITEAIKEIKNEKP